MQQRNEVILKALQECAEACDMCAESCLHEPMVADLVRCIKLDLDCAEVCHEAIRLIKRNSEIQTQFIEMCANVCKMCEEECEEHQDMHDHCRICADACRRCYEACQTFASVGR